MIARFIGLIVLCLSVSLFGAAAVAVSAAEPVMHLDLQIDDAIDRGVAHLLKTVAGPEGWIPCFEFQQGYAALQVYALVKSDVSFQHPDVQKGIAAVEILPSEKVYSVAMRLLAWGAIVEQIDADARLGGQKSSADRTRALDRMRTALEWLLSARVPGRGAWNYQPVPPPPDPKPDPKTYRVDNSNTQFAALALGVAAQHGLKVPDEVWQAIADHFTGTQDRDGPLVRISPVFREDAEGARRENKTAAKKAAGLYTAARAGESLEAHARGWKYVGEEFEKPKLSMACAGLSSLLLAERHLGNQKSFDDRAMRIRRALRDGYGWVCESFLERTPERIEPFFVFYDLYSLEKVGDIGGIEAFGAMRWYQEGAVRLLKLQRADGGWGPIGEKEVSRQNSALALLFLSRATDLHGRARPVARAVTSSSAGAPVRKAQSGWVHVPSLKGDVSVSRLFRLYTYRPNRGLQKIVEEAVRGYDPEEPDALVRGLAQCVERTPFQAVSESAHKLLDKVTGAVRLDVVRARVWLERWDEASRAGREKDRAAVASLCARLREAEGPVLKRRIIWALERTGAKEAQLDLADALGDPELSVRERAHAALVFLSGQNLPFDAKAGAEIRRAQAMAWKEAVRSGGEK